MTEVYYIIIYIVPLQQCAIAADRVVFDFRGENGRCG